MTKYRQRAKKKKFDPNKIHLHHLRQQWMEQVAVEKQEHLDHMFKTQYKQQFPLPLKGKPAYVMGTIIKYLLLVFIVYTVVSLSILIGFDDAFIEKYWRILGSVILILPIFILLHRTIYTPQSKVIIQNFQIYPDTVAILFTDGSTEQIHYCDIDSVHMVSVVKTHHMEIRYTLTHKKELQDYPRMFELDFTFKKVFFLKNKYQMYSAFLQQLQIKNPSARIDTGSWYKSAFNMESFQLNERRLLIIKWSNILFWAIFVMTIFVVLFYPEYKHYFK